MVQVGHFGLVFTFDASQAHSAEFSGVVHIGLVFIKIAYTPVNSDNIRLRAHKAVRRTWGGSNSMHSTASKAPVKLSDGTLGSVHGTFDKIKRRTEKGTTNLSWGRSVDFPAYVSDY